MKVYFFTILAALVLLTACGKAPKPSTTPLHHSEPAIVPTNEDEMRNLVLSMVDAENKDEFLSNEFRSLLVEAQHLVAGNRDSIPYTAFDWTCNDGIDAVNITQDSVTVDISCAGAGARKNYTLVMRHEHGKWCIDDILWQGLDTTIDTERHAAQAYIDDAINYLTSSDANYIVDNRLTMMVKHCQSHPEDKPMVALNIETAHNFLKQNRGYTPELEMKILTLLQKVK